MSAKTDKENVQTVKQIEYFSKALKAPRIREAAVRLGDQARESSWTHEEYLAAVLSREVSARETSGAELRIRGSGLPGRKSLEDFNFDHQPGLNRETIAHLSTATLSPSKAAPTGSRTPASTRCPPREPRTRHNKHTTRGLHFDHHNRPTIR